MYHLLFCGSDDTGVITLAIFWPIKQYKCLVMLMDFPYKHVHEVWVGNSSADPFDTILGCPWKWSQLVKKLVYNLLKGCLQPTYSIHACPSSVSQSHASWARPASWHFRSPPPTPTSRARLLLVPSERRLTPDLLPLAKEKVNPGPQWVSTEWAGRLGAARALVRVNPQEAWSDWSAQTTWTSCSCRSTAVGRIRDEAGHYSAHVGADQFGISTVTAWTLRIDVHLGGSCLHCVHFIGGSHASEGDVHLLSTSRTSQYDYHPSTQPKPSKEQPPPGLLEKKKDTNVGTRDQPLKVTLMLSSCKNSPVARHLPWRPGEMVRSHHAVFFQRVWHTWYENRGCLELEDVNVNFLVAFPKKL